MSTKTICDKCNKEIRPGADVFRAEAFEHDDKTQVPLHRFRDLCRPCVDAMFAVYPTEAQEVKRG